MSVRTVTAASQAGLERALEPWLAQGYERKAWVEVPLDLEGETDAQE